MPTRRDTLQAVALLLACACMLSLTIHGATVLAAISRELKEDRVRHEPILTEHVEALREHERRMQSQ